MNADVYRITFFSGHGQVRPILSSRMSLNKIELWQCHQTIDLYFFFLSTVIR